jgi:protocatechuate 3,4-dioxygenase beta subunit/5-hydroxyisourate hydrolase-like protein (transthyretin family)
MIERKSVRAATASFRLAAGKPRKLQVRDDKGKGMPGVMIWVEEWLVGRTSETGFIDLVLPGTAGAAMHLATEDGRHLRYRLKALKPGTQEPDVATLPAVVILAGRLVSAADGRPLAGAVAWVSEEPSTAVRTGGDGTFRLSVSTEPASSLEGAAAGFFAGNAEAGGNRRSPSMALKPKVAATGVVVDEAGRGLPGAGVTATRMPGARSSMMDFSLYRSGGFARSGAGGRFRLPNLAPAVPYNLRISLPGFAPARAELPAREQGQPAPELKIVLRVGRQAVGMVLDGSRAGVAGAQVRLRPAASSDPMARLRNAMNPDATDRIEGTTDAKGRYTVSHLPPGTYDVTVQARGFATLTVPGLAIPEGQGMTDLGTVVLSPGATLEGRVVDPAGQPIEGAEVRAVAGGAGGMTLRFMSRDQGAPDAFTAADGSFRLEDRSPGESLDLAVSHPSYGPGNAPGVTVPTQEPVRIVLQPMTRVSGRTVSKDGKGIAGADVTLTEITPMSFGGMSRMRPGNWKRTVTDADGAFSFAAVSPGAIEVRAEAPRYQAAELQGIEAKAGQELAGLELLLPPAASVEGRVLSPDGRPVPGAEVTVVQSDSVTGFGFSGLYAQTDGDGRYNLEGVPPGPRTLEARANGYRRAVRDLEVTAGAANTADLTLERGFEVSGRVIDEAGNPVASAQLTMIAGSDFFSGALSNLSGADGSFHFAGVQEGTFRLMARKAGYAANSQGDTVTVAGASVNGVEVKLTAGGTISGRLSGLEFSQLSRVRITANGFRPGQVDPDGAYTIPNMPPGEWQVEATVPDTSLHAEGHVTLEPGMVEAKLDLQFGKGFTLTGIVLRNGAPLAGAGLRLERTGTVSTYQAASDHQGAFRFGGLDAGNYQLTVNTATGAQHKEPVEISGDREVQIDLKSASLTGRVIDAADSSPVTGAEVTLEAVDDRESRFHEMTTNTDSRGAFRVAEVADGTWKLRASHEGYAPAEKEVQIAGADADGVEVSLSPTEGLTIEVVLSSGQTPERIRAGALDPSGRTVVAGYYPVGENGRVRLSNVPPGSWQIFVDSDYAAPTSVAAAVPGPAVRVLLPPAGQVRVKVPALAKENTAATVSFLGSGGVAYRAFDYNEQIASQWDLFQGNRSFPRIPVGTWQVTAKAADGRTFTGTAAVTPGGVVEVVLK